MILDVADIVLYIRNFTDAWTFWALCSTSTKMKDYKYRYLIWCLNVEASLLYASDKEFREKVCSRMSSVGNQLHIRLEDADYVADVSALGGVLYVGLSGQEYVVPTYIVSLHCTDYIL